MILCEILLDVKCQVNSEGAFQNITVDLHILFLMWQVGDGDVFNL